MKEIIDFLVLIVLYFSLFYRRWKLKGRACLFINTLLYIYLSFVLYFTLMPIVVSLPFIFNHPYEVMNFAPFIDVFYGRGDFFRQIFLNVLMMIPFGILFPLATNKKFGKTLLYAFLLSLSIELLQPLLNGFRSSDITDLITNLFGAFIGYIIYLIFKPIIFKVLKILSK